VSDNHTKVALWVVGAAAAAAIIGTLTVGARSHSGRAPSAINPDPAMTASAQSGAAAPSGELPPGLSLLSMVAASAPHAPAAAQPGAQAPAADTGAPLAQVAFESGQAGLSAKAKALLIDIADSVKTMDGATLVLSGFHDTTGSPELNAKLAKDRALAVRDALVARGLGADRIKLLKPQVMVGASDPDLARRVDIGLIR
jgi:cytochrome c oxidase subunit II